LAAHQPGKSSLLLIVEEPGLMRGEYHVADVDLESIRLMLEDLAQRTGAEKTPGVGALPWVQITGADSPLDLVASAPVSVESDGKPHTMVPFNVRYPEGIDMIGVEFDNFFSFDPQHRVVTSLETGDGTKVGMLSMDEPAWSVQLSTPGSMTQFIRFTWEGVWHIWIGIDHILFLIALLLPSVVHFRDGKWEPVSEFREAFYTVIKVVTAFTIAHSVTLSLAALEIISLPSKLVESTIALSVALAALNNIYPIVRKNIWLVAFGFGLIHGFGFANVLADLALPAGTLAIALLSFNIGVELGQVAIVLVFFPFIFLIRFNPLYLPLKLRLGSAVIALVAVGWIFDRVFEMNFMPF
jgi:hypothetical protein